MEQLGIWHESTIEMTDAFMKLWNQAEKDRNDIQNIKLIVSFNTFKGVIT